MRSTKNDWVVCICVCVCVHLINNTIKHTFFYGGFIFRYFIRIDLLVGKKNYKLGNNKIRFTKNASYFLKVISVICVSHAIFCFVLFCHSHLAILFISDINWIQACQIKDEKHR